MAPVVERLRSLFGRAAIMLRRMACVLLVAVGPGLSATAESSGVLLAMPWNEAKESSHEVGAYAVNWFWHAGDDEVLSTGIKTTVPLERRVLWRASYGYDAISEQSGLIRSISAEPAGNGVEEVRVGLKVLWVDLNLVLKVERRAEESIRFSIDHAVFGRYRGELFLEAEREDASQTRITFAGRFTAKQTIPRPLELTVLRMVTLGGLNAFLEVAAGMTSVHPG